MDNKIVDIWANNEAKIVNLIRDSVQKGVYRGMKMHDNATAPIINELGLYRVAIEHCIKTLAEEKNIEETLRILKRALEHSGSEDQSPINVESGAK